MNEGEIIKKQQIFNEIERHLLNDEKPSIFLKEFFMENKDNFIYPFTMISDLQDVPQEPKHHPEGNVLVHVMMVVDEAARRRSLSKEKDILMWSSLLHDIGKKPTTKKRKNRWTSYDHDKVGAKMVMEFFNALNCTKEKLIKGVSSMTRWHMQALFVINNLPFASIGEMIEEVDIEELSLLTISDRLGRGKLNPSEKDKIVHDVNFFLEKVSAISGYEYKKIH